MEHVRDTRLLQGLLFVPHFILVSVSMLAIFGTMLVLHGADEQESVLSSRKLSQESIMSSRRLSQESNMSSRRLSQESNMSSRRLSQESVMSFRRLSQESVMSSRRLSQENVMSARRVFLAMGLFHAVKISVAVFLPFAFVYLPEIFVTGARIKVVQGETTIE
ncbi:hypothetical protein RRG08_008570 [Elysia crispata]|uniref:Uncharacterized protein n=1 Tax=Elysia crispata TaxID=231223 RepID=A0AAE0Y179_9GAST|nr:hypothetical protein RRG08_008570 [Elysia crispata]